MSQLSASDYTSVLAKKLADELLAGEQLTLQSVEQNYHSTAAACGLPPTGADSLHIKDIYNLVAREATALSVMSKDDAARRIFSLIDMH